MTKVTVVILNWNRPKLTSECVYSVKEVNREGINLKIIVVDNASSDDSIKKLLKIKGITIIGNNKNLGFAEGNNVGISQSINDKADYILILNNDTTVDKDLIFQLLKVAKKYPKAGAISPKIYFAKGFEYKKKYLAKDKGKVIWYAGGKMDWENVLGATNGVDKVDKGQFEKTIETDFATGTAMFLNTKALNQTGFFDKRYFMYYEDTDLSMRMKKAGWKVLYAPKALVWHKVAQSSRIGGDLSDYYTTRNRLLFGIKHAPLRAKIALIRESFVLAGLGRKWQKRGAMDFYLRRLGKGSYK